MKHNPLTADNQIFDKMIGGVHMFVNLIVMTSVPHCTPLHKVQSAMHLTDHCAERRPGISQSTWNKRNTIVCCSWLIVTRMDGRGTCCQGCIYHDNKHPLYSCRCSWKEGAISYQKAGRLKLHPWTLQQLLHEPRSLSVQRCNLFVSTWRTVLGAICWQWLCGLTHCLNLNRQFVLLL